MTVYEQGKTYRAATGETLVVEELNDKEAIIKLPLNLEGKILEEPLFISGPIENFQSFMASVGAVEVANVLQ